MLERQKRAYSQIGYGDWRSIVRIAFRYELTQLDGWCCHSFSRKVGNVHSRLQRPHHLYHGSKISIRTVWHPWKRYVFRRGVRYFQAYENILKYTGFPDYTWVLKKQIIWKMCQYWNSREVRILYFKVFITKLFNTVSNLGIITGVWDRFFLIPVFKWEIGVSDLLICPMLINGERGF